MKTYEHDPDAELDYGVDWSDWLNDGDSINSSSWSIDPSGELVIVDGSQSFSSGEAKCELKIDSGANPDDGSYYSVTNTITTTDGLTDQRTFLIHLKEK